jgi:hypothetical protein
MKFDLYIYFSGNHYVSGNCSRWDVNDYSVVIETWLKKRAYNDLNDNIRPGAVKELYKILGKPKYVDTSWQGKNTLRLYPVPGSTSKLNKMRREVLIYPKSITSNPIKGPSGWIQIKIEGYTSSNSL